MKNLIKRYEKLKDDQEEIKIEIEKLRKECLTFAIYKEGDIVEYKESNYRGGFNIKKGIIRYSASKTQWRDDLNIYYSVGKITKSENIHKSQDIHYSLIPENELTLVKNNETNL